MASVPGPMDFLSGLGPLPKPYDAQQQVISDQQQQQGNQQALQMGALKMAAIGQQQQQEQQYQTDVQSALHTGNFADLYAKYPDQQKALQAAHDALDEPAKRTQERDLFAVSSYIKNGAVDSAKTLLQRRIDADKAAGHPADDDQQMLDALNSGDPNQVKAAADMALYAVLPEDKRAEFFTKTGKDDQYTLAPGSKRFDATGHLVAEAPFAPEYRSVGAGDSLVQVGGGGPASDSGAPSGSAGAPLSVRLNNPGAIRFDPSSDWQGQVGNEDGFVKFATPADGRRAQLKLISNQIKSGYDTPLAWAKHYAPASDGNDPAAYAATIASGLGIGVNDKIPMAAVPKMAALSAGVESGGTPAPGGVQAGDARVIATGAPKPGYTMLTPQEKASIPGLDPNTVYQRAPDGQITAVGGQSRSQLKPWPQTALTGRSANQSSLAQIDQAIAALDPALAKGDKKRLAAISQNRYAIGPSNYVTPNWALQKTNPTGNAIRAMLGQIGGIIVHDISGAAVGVKEDERLSKWVPRDTDDPDAALTKLRQLRNNINQKNSAMDDTFSEDQGYRPFHASGAASTSAAVKVGTAKEWAALRKGTPYIDPHGVRRVKS